MKKANSLFDSRQFVDARDGSFYPPLSQSERRYCANKKGSSAIPQSKKKEASLPCLRYSYQSMYSSRLSRPRVRLSGHNLARFIGRIPSRLTDRLERNIERKKEANSSRFLSSVRPRMREMSFRRIKETEVASFLGKKIFGRSTDDIPSFWACVSSANIYIYTVWYTYIQWRGAFSSLPEKKTDKKASFFLSRPFVRPLLV